MPKQQAAKERSVRLNKTAANFSWYVATRTLLLWLWVILIRLLFLLQKILKYTKAITDCTHQRKSEEELCSNHWLFPPFFVQLMDCVLTTPLGKVSKRTAVDCARWSQYRQQQSWLAADSQKDKQIITTQITSLPMPTLVHILSL